MAGSGLARNPFKEGIGRGHERALEKLARTGSMGGFSGQAIFNHDPDVVVHAVLQISCSCVCWFFRVLVVAGHGVEQR